VPELFYGKPEAPKPLDEQIRVTVSSAGYPESEHIPAMGRERLGVTRTDWRRCGKVTIR